MQQQKECQRSSKKNVTRQKYLLEIYEGTGVHYVTMRHYWPGSNTHICIFTHPNSFC